MVPWMVPLSVIESMIIDSMILNGTIEYHSMIVAFNDSIIDLYQGFQAMNVKTMSQEKICNYAIRNQVMISRQAYIH